MSEKRVVITGIDVLTSNANNIEEYESALKNGVSGIGNITAYDITEHKVKIAGEVKNFNPADFIDSKVAKRMDRFSQFAIKTAIGAVKDSNLIINESNAKRVGVIVGTGIGGISTYGKQYEIMMKKGPRRVSPLLIPMLIGNMASGNIAIEIGAKGTNYVVTTACASSTHAIGEAAEAIKRGIADVIVTGGTEATITPLTVTGFTNMKALTASFNDTPKKASRPFDKDRDGFVIAEGSGMLILEEYEHAKKRSAKIYGELAGYGSTCDAFHITSPAEDGEGAARAMTEAMEMAGLNPEDIGYINAHGTSTPLNDKFETMAIKRVFKDLALNVPISSTKSMTGHLLGGAGAIELIACIIAMNKGFLPPTINYETPDPECDLDYVPNTAREKQFKAAISNSLGFGGHNASLVLKKM